MGLVTRGRKSDSACGGVGRRIGRRALVAGPTEEPVAKPTHLPEQADAHTREGKARG